MKIIHGDCLEELKELPDNSIDSIVTDPPYGLSFMGKKWDYDVPSEEVWKECLRVLKPGGYLLSFAGTRTQHRMAVRIEDAGFEIRDMIAWVYGCLSFDTEVLTERGFRHLHKLTQYDRIVVYDIEKNIYKWERPQRWNIYQVHEDTAYRIKSDYTDQIVSRNHRCLVEREGKLVFIQAEELNNLEYMPTLQSDFFTLQKRYWKLLFSDLLWKGKELAKGYWTPWEKRLDRKKYGELSNKNDWREKSSVERWSNLFQKTRKLQTNKVCAMSEAIFADGTKRRLCDGTSFDFSKLNQSLPIENGSGASHQSQSAGQPIRKSDVIQIKQGTQITRRARVEKIKYSGIIFCPTVSTGAFVARRNGQVFITGNSGFPKSLNIGKAIDKGEGTEYPKNTVVSENGSMSGANYTRLTREIESPLAKQWEGWGTALKPSHEDITVARKPLYSSGDFAIMAQKIIANICQLPSVARIVEKTLASSQSESEEGVGIARWTAGDSTSTLAVLSDLMDMLRSESEKTSSLSTELSWLNTLDDLLKNESMFTTETKTSLIIDLKILNSLLSKITQSTTTKDETKQNGEDTNASLVEHTFSVFGLKLKTIQEHFVGESAISRAGEQDLRPSLEPIVVARKPFKGTVAENVLTHGTGGLNIDGCRVGTETITQRLATVEGGKAIGAKAVGIKQKATGETTTTIGRWPANLIHDGSDEVLECFPNDSQRFFYCAKASKKDRDEGLEGFDGKWKRYMSEKLTEQRRDGLTMSKNNHPTVKPTALMRYLVKLVTPPGGTVLDPFAGSGSTGKACKLEGFEFIGIEREEEYVKIAEARIAAVTHQPTLV